MDTDVPDTTSRWVTNQIMSTNSAWKNMYSDSQLTQEIV